MKIVLIVIGLVIIGLFAYFFFAQPKNMRTEPDEVTHAKLASDNDSDEDMISEQRKNGPRAPELVRPSDFINTEGVTLEEARSEHKVVLLHFWTYGCINCKRTLGHINNWYEKYHKDGLEIIGVHYPEFSYERKVENVESFVRKADIQYPVVLDNDAGTWSAYKNRYWPHRYLIDEEGYIIFDHIGEGAYAQTEDIIKKILYDKE